MEAAQHWARCLFTPKNTDGNYEGSIKEMEKCGAPPEVIEKLRGKSEKKEIENYQIWQENWPVVELFLKSKTQWKHAPMGGFVGLDYPGVESVAKLSGVSLSPEMFFDLQLVEQSALGEIASIRSEGK